MRSPELNKQPDPSLSITVAADREALCSDVKRANTMIVRIVPASCFHVGLGILGLAAFSIQCKMPSGLSRQEKQRRLTSLWVNFRVPNGLCLGESGHGFGTPRHAYSATRQEQNPNTLRQNFVLVKR